MDAKDQIKRRVSITDVAALYVDLKPAGKNLKALCPFHTEKTPSFFVMPEKDTFSCYGCNKFGDIFTLVQEMENISFSEAMNFLIEKFHVPVDKSDHRKSEPTDIYAQINTIAAKYFKDNLYDSPEGKKAMTYLKQRGIGEDTIRLFSLGYAEDKWDGLYNHLRRKSCDLNKAEELGLLIRNPQKNSIYDRFRGRIMFPIFSESGALIAFGGRTIFDEPNKYLNSPDTPLYKKSKHLYGFNFTKTEIREKKAAILVEGYFDMVSLYQNGVKNAVASLGTALTENQVYLLKRFADSIYIYYDSDKAGIAAAVRGIEKMFEQNINPRVIVSPDVKDPDDFIRQSGLKAFLQLLDQSSDGFKFLLDNVARKYNQQIPEQKSRAVESMMGFVGKFSDPIVRDEYIRMTSVYFNVDEKMLKLKNDGKSPNVQDKLVKTLVITPAERIFLQSIFSLPQLIGEVKGLFDDKLLAVLPSRNIIRLLIQNYDSTTKSIVNIDKIAGKLSDPERAEFRSIYESVGNKKGDIDKLELERKVEASVLKFIDIRNKQETRRIDRQIKIAERENNISEVLRLMNEKNRFIKRKYNKSMDTGGAVEIL